jgi:hypothetical protein
MIIIKKIILLILIIIPNTFFSQELPIEPVLEICHELDYYPKLEYPNTGYEELCSYFENGKVLIFGYGTLANPSSALQTLSRETYANLKLGIGFGLKRVLNVDGHVGGFLPDLTDPHYQDEYVSWHHKQGMAILNAIPQNNYEAIINGVLLEVNAEELKRLIDRERGYDLIPIIVMDWQDGYPYFCGKARIAYTFSASDQPREGTIYTNYNLKPRIPYMCRIREGFYRNQSGLLQGTNHGWTIFRHFLEYSMFLGDGTSAERRFYVQT